VHTIDPDGAGGVAPFATYCEMQADGGGWTLVLKADGNQSTFRYDAVEWTNASVVNPTATALDRVEAKLASFSTVPFTAMRLGMVEGAASVRYITIPLSASSLLALVGTTNTFTATGVAKSTWASLMLSPSLQANCNRQGVNVYGPFGDPWPRVRIGFLANEQNECSSPDSYIGIGISATLSSLSSLGGIAPTVGNAACCSAANGDRATKAFGYLFVR
jgi:hypothetical protein